MYRYEWQSGALLDIYIIGVLNVPYVALRLVSSFFIVAILGVLGGIAWSVLYPHLKTIKNIFLTPAFIIYGVVTLLGFSGAIAALALVSLLGTCTLSVLLIGFRAAHVKQVELTPHKVTFLSQLVQLLKSFFFIYLGLWPKDRNNQVKKNPSQRLKKMLK